uniref:Uncharacterized protein n=1 Tax=Meloidogyne enterolobii TaxID=390850 RepID=A0A6V7Y6T3_MELEN|nr:unnamed protein product [Meloidogyne enterolobii]
MKRRIFVDFALVICNIYSEYLDRNIFVDFCYSEEKYFDNYCDLKSLSNPINATFNVS